MDPVFVIVLAFGAVYIIPSVVASSGAPQVQDWKQSIERFSASP
jgi:hypothetical protein